jgi:phosphoglycolate phosphatase
MEFSRLNQKMGHKGFSGLLEKVGMHGYSGVIFDLDGTLIDSAPGIVGTISHLLDAKGITPVRVLDHTIVGPPLDIMFDQLLGENDRMFKEMLIEGYKQHYDHEGYRQSRVFDGVDDVLTSLKAMGVGLHIATNKRLAPTLNILRYFDWTDAFSSVYAVDSHNTRFASKSEMLATVIANQGLDKARVIYVGDTKSDELAAAENQIDYFHAFWGYE